MLRLRSACRKAGREPFIRTFLERDIPQFGLRSVTLAVQKTGGNGFAASGFPVVSGLMGSPVVVMSSHGSAEVRA